MKNKWLNTALFYQIPPASFYDLDGDGIGDIRGITEKLGYVAELGISANDEWQIISQENKGYPFAYKKDSRF